MSETNRHTLDMAVEAIIFAADEPVSVDALRSTFSDVAGADATAEDVEEAVARLNAAYEVEGHALRIHHWGGGFRMATVESMAGFVKAFLLKEEEKRLSRALLETLSVVAYKQPVAKPEVDFVRGVQSDYAIHQLMERDFITVVGRADSVGRPLLYGTTEHFLDQFGLGTLEELPRPREINELLEDPAFSKERAVLASEMAMMEAEAASSAENGVETIEESEEMVDVFETEEVADVAENVVDVEEIGFATDSEDARIEEARDIESESEEPVGVVESLADVKDTVDKEDIHTTNAVVDVDEQVEKNVRTEVPHE